MLRRIWILTLGLLLGGSFYLLLIDTPSSPELYALAVVAILCGVSFVLSREQAFTEARVRPWWILTGWRVLAKIVPDILRLCVLALAQLYRPRPVRGVFRAVPFAATGQNPEDAGRRAVTECWGSLSPNTYVVGVDAERGLLLVHQLGRDGNTGQVDPMGLG